MTQIRIATAGWTIPRLVADAFAADGVGLARYASRFDAVELNSTFYRSPRPQTYSRWAETVGVDFRFAVKLPKAITHQARLIGVSDQIEAFRAEAEQLGDKLGPLLAQLPPSLAFEAEAHGQFISHLRSVWSGPVVCEPRHASWFSDTADALLSDHRVSRVAADPARHPDAGRPGGWRGFEYWRLHGSPRVYFSSYDDAALQALGRKLTESAAAETWCVFDNTASGAAAANALTLQKSLTLPKETNR